MTQKSQFFISMVVLISIISSFQTNALTKDEVYKNITKKRNRATFAFKADIISKVHVQGHTVKDSGTIIYSPPDCIKISMYNAKTEVSVLGDTTWTVLSNGNVTRSIGGKNMPGMNNVGQSYGVPDGSDLLKESDFTIIEDKPGKHVVIEFNMSMPTGMQKSQATYDSKNWLLRNMKILAGPTGTIETGYSYTTFKGVPMLSKVNMVMGTMGFMIMDYKNFNSIKKLPRKSFKKF